MGDKQCAVLDEPSTQEICRSGEGNVACGKIADRARVVEGRRVARTILPEAGRALETLGHAIEYLMDEANLSLLQGSGRNEIAGMAEAIDLLKAANREVYFECPMVLPSAVRVGLAWLRWSYRVS